METVMLFSIKDKVADEFGPVFASKNFGVARRCFSKLIADTDSFTATEFELYYVGGFNHSTGVIDAFNKPVLVLDDGLDSLIAPEVNHV